MSSKSIQSNGSLWLNVAMPTLGVVLLYYAVGARPVSQQLATLSSEQVRLQQAIEKLEGRDSEINRSLQQLAMESAAPTPALAENERLLFVGTEVVSSPQTFGQLLELFERHRVQCQQTSREEHSDRGHSPKSSYTFQLVGSFADVSAALQEAVEILPTVVPEQLHLRREANGICRWEIVCQLERSSP